MSLLNFGGKKDLGLILYGLGMLGAKRRDQADRYMQNIGGILQDRKEWERSAEDRKLKRDLTQAQIEALQRGQGGRIGTYNPRDYTTESWAKYMQTNNPADLKRFATLRPATQAGVPGMVNVITGEFTPSSTLQAETDAARRLSGADAFGAESGRLAAEAGMGDPFDPNAAGMNLTITGQPIPSKADIAAQVSDVGSAADRANELFDAADTLESSMGTLRDARQAVLDGAGTGPLQKAWPSYREASVRLDNIQGRAALDIVGATTFGALSKGELDLSKDIALPTGLEGPELVKWIDDKIAADMAKAAYLREQATFLSTPDENGRRRTKKDWSNYQKAIMDRALEAMNANEDDIKETMRANNMDRSSVLREIRRRYLADGGS